MGERPHFEAAVPRRRVGLVVARRYAGFAGNTFLSTAYLTWLPSFMQNLLGSSLGPVVVGAVSDLRGLKTAMLLVPSTSVLAGTLFLVASRFYQRDAASVRKVRIRMEKA